MPTCRLGLAPQAPSDPPSNVTRARWEPTFGLFLVAEWPSPKGSRGARGVKTARLGHEPPTTRLGAPPVALAHRRTNPCSAYADLFLVPQRLSWKDFWDVQLARPPKVTPEQAETTFLRTPVVKVTLGRSHFPLLAHFWTHGHLFFGSHMGPRTPRDRWHGKGDLRKHKGGHPAHGAAILWCWTPCDANGARGRPVWASRGQLGTEMGQYVTKRESKRRHRC